MVYDSIRYGRWTPEEMDEYRAGLRRIEAEKLERQYDAWCDKHHYIPKVFQPTEFLKKRGLLA